MLYSIAFCQMMTVQKPLPQHRKSKVRWILTEYVPYGTELKHWWIATQNVLAEKHWQIDCFAKQLKFDYESGVYFIRVFPHYLNKSYTIILYRLKVTALVIRQKCYFSKSSVLALLAMLKEYIYLI